ncbi:MAG: peroxiredoxin [Myxococcales bacterium]|nr:peroxiredoxin [Myxococcales bacterium]
MLERTAPAVAVVLSLLAGCKREAPAPSPTTTPSSSAPVAANPTQPARANEAVAPAAAAGLRVDSPSRESLVAQGQDAPRFRATAHDGRVIESAGPRARPLVVYFYPRDETPGCTVEAEGFRDASREFEAAGVDVVGVSTDSNDAHRGFATNHQLGFALVSDPEAKLAGAFGVGVRMGYASRVTIVIDRSGRVSRVFESVTPAGHATEVLAAARAS